MQRTKFLEALPFLLPVESSAWPPTLPADTVDRKSCRRETLLRGHLLSIEPLESMMSETDEPLSQQTIHRSTGPAYFVPDSKTGNSSTTHTCTEPAVDANFDPSMCPLEVSIQTAELHPTSGSALTPHRLVPTPSKPFMSPTAYQKLLGRHAASAQDPPVLQESALFFRIHHTRVYQVDLRGIENIDVQVSDSSLQSDQPPSLLIQFGNLCLFRIFGLGGGTVTADTYTTLKGVQSKLVQLLTGEDQIPAPFPLPPISTAAHPPSPAGSSTTAGAYSGSTEPGQRDFGHASTTTTTTTTTTTSRAEEAKETPQPKLVTHEEATTHSSREGRALSVPPESATPTAPKDQESSCSSASSLDRHKTAYDQAEADLEGLSQLLSRDDSQQEEAALHEEWKRLMTSLPENIAQSYCQQAQVEQALHTQWEELERHRSQLEDLVTSFWPTAKRKRTSLDGTPSSSSLSRTTTTPNTEDRPSRSMSAEECIARAYELDELHQQADEKRLELLFLPLRG